jgi:general secretion pathway protein A
MYNQFFRLRENPFNVNPDPRYLFLTHQTEEAWDGLKQGIQARKGLLLLTGEVGTGKTTLLNHLLDWLHQQRAPTAFIFNSHLEISHLFDFVLSDFAVKFDVRLKDNALMRLHQWLWERYRAGDTPVVIVDEAQGLPNRVLEEIRMLLNLETSNEKLLQIVLAGQPELEARLQHPELREVKQRIALRCKTAALSLDEAHQYVQARLHIAGADGLPIFASDAMDAVHFYSRGIPRVMNLLCEHALINASAQQIQPVPARFVAEVASEFQFDDGRRFPPSSNFADGPRPSAVPVQSRFLNALVSLSTTDEHESRAPESLGPSVVPAPHWQAPSDNAFSRVQETAAPLSHRENLLGDPADPARAAQPPATCLSSRSEHAIARPFAQAFASPFAHGFATPSESATTPLSEHTSDVSSQQPFVLTSEQNFATRSEQSLALISEQNFARRSEHALAACSEQNFATPAELFHVQPAAPAAAWHTQLEARLLADWTSVFSDIGSSLASDPAAEPVAPTHPPRLHIVEPKPVTTVSPAARRRPVPNFQNSARLSTSTDAKKSFAPNSALIKLVALRAILVACTIKGAARFSSVVSPVARSHTLAHITQRSARFWSAITAPARSSIIAHITQLHARCRSSARSLYWECLAWIDRCLNIAASIDWPQLWLTVSSWLRQPCDPTQWRPQDARLFGELRRFNHKKM